MKFHSFLPLFLFCLTPLTPLAEGSPSTPATAQVCAQLNQAADKTPSSSSNKVDVNSLMRARALRTLAKAIKRLEKHPENINVGSKGKNITPLMIATGLGQKDAIRWLVAHGADPSIKDAEGKDCFARTEDKTLTSLLKEGGIFSWKQALEHLEAIKPEDWPKVETDISPFYGNVYLNWAVTTPPPREEILQRCHKLAKGEAEDALEETRKLLLYFTRLGNMQMVSFLLRSQKNTETLTFYTSSHIDAPFPLLLLAAECVPAQNRFAMLNLLIAYGVNKPGAFDIPAHAPAMRDDKKLWKWVLDHCAWDACLENGAMWGNIGFMKAALAKAKRVEKDKGKISMSFVKPTAAALSYATREGGSDEALRFLLAHPARGGICAAEAFHWAVSNHRLDLLEILAKAKVEQCYEFQIELEAVTREAALQGSLWFVARPEVFRALLPLLQEAPRTDYLSYRLMAASEENNLEMATLLLEHGADPRYGNGERNTLNVAKSEEMKKLLQEAIEKRGE